LTSASTEVALVAALEREVGGLIRGWTHVEREHAGRKFVFFERDELIVVCGGIGAEAARRAAEAVIGLYHPAMLQSVGFAGALGTTLQIGDIFVPGVIVDACDNSRTEIPGGSGVLVTFMAVAGVEQKKNLAQAYGAQAVDMEAAAVAAAASAHGLRYGAIKVISDELNFEMPEMARFIDSRGRFKTGSFTAFAMLRPWLWMRVAQLGKNSSKAARTLAAHLRGLRSSPVSAVEAKSV
jgi:adenosylhomocysteine nucleosidase